jgi:hypothetical protein
MIGIFDSPFEVTVKSFPMKLVVDMSNQTGSQPRRSIDRGRKSLSNSDYQRSLERIIQRDYFPDAEIEPSDAASPTPIATQRSLVVVPSDDSLHHTLTSFHAETTSCETEKWKQQQERDARNREQRQVSIYGASSPHCSPDQDYDSSDNDDGNEIGRQKLYDRPPPHYTELRNALFFPPDPSTTAFEVYANGNVASRLETAASPDHVLPRTRPQAALHDVFAPFTQPIIDPTATRFPRPVAQRRPSHHWEGSDLEEEETNHNDDVSTDLDSTVAVSIRSEIRRATAKTQRAHRATNRQPPPPAAAPESLQYRFPPISPRMTLNRTNASTSAATSNTMGPPKPRSAVKATPRKRARTSTSSKMATTPSVRSSGSFAFSLRQAYSKPIAVKVSTPKRPMGR